jgi:hypothetical protein
MAIRKCRDRTKTSFNARGPMLKAPYHLSPQFVVPRISPV